MPANVRTMVAEPAFGPATTLGESPVWDSRTGELVWIDIDGGALLHAHPGEREALVQPCEEALAAVVLSDEGGYVGATASAIVSLGLDGSFATRQPLAFPEGVRPNDGGVDPAGRFWFGTMVTRGHPERAALYRADREDAEPVKVVEGLTIGNGVAWSPDSRTFYLVDSAVRRVDQFEFDVASGCLRGRRSFVEFRPGIGIPDGLCVDIDGTVWVAAWGGSAVLGFDQEGSQVARVELPVPLVTNCSFGGRDLRTMYVTTANRGPLRGVGGRLAGTVFAAQMRAPGIPARAAAWVRQRGEADPEQAG